MIAARSADAYIRECVFIVEKRGCGHPRSYRSYRFSPRTRHQLLLKRHSSGDFTKPAFTGLFSI